MLKGFKDFILRGNIIELAIAVVIGTAFTAIVTSFTNNIINPLIAAVGGPGNIGLGFHILSGNESTFVNIGAVLTAAITFLITAGVVYFIFVVPMNRINARMRRGKEAELETAPTDVQLLIEIRDLLRAQSTGPTPPTVS
ncbi:large conductance mechanosensitive channel protein MscL [Nakamurella endophytica]|uniref:large conductance mechanosensitive channel protein MscL n=1 Tax=Nakamurella endophytica TaxID=1748367 RepID=UPI00166A8A01